tara:strand:- start:40 stop:228 length:189 start_codon:yes stop_codon:yes gene_type:complete
MIDLTQHDKNALTGHVFADSYFSIERDNRPFLLALVAEEFCYTPEQKANLIQALDAEIEFDR